MTAIVEGIYKHGTIELQDVPAGLPEGRVRVIIMTPPSGARRMMTFGMCRGSNMSTLEDFKAAEWHGEEEFDDTYGR